ncbi:MAG TPA: hypothetical protein VGP68_22005 [Gemmataceae bacterium]|nr:hypothetical protein [Gemmataceae bacterium]
MTGEGQILGIVAPIVLAGHDVFDVKLGERSECLGKVAIFATICSTFTNQCPGRGINHDYE